MSTPLEPQQQQQPPPPPPTDFNQQANETHSDHMMIGPVIAVLAVITILGFISVMIGRLCSGRRVWGIGEYDFEGWVERKCSSCINGRIDFPPPPPNDSSDSVPVAIPIEIPEESKQTEQPPQNPHAATDS